MTQVGDVLYTITEAWIAPLTDAVAGAYGTPVKIDLIDKITFDNDSDNATIKSGGQVLELLSVPTSVSGEISQASVDFASLNVMCGFVNGIYNQYYVMDFQMGGAGLPYFGLIYNAASTNGANALVGFPKMKLDSIPGFEQDQNKFRVGKAKFKAIAPTTGRRGAYRIKQNAAAAGVPSTAGNFLAFFTTPPPGLWS